MGACLQKIASKLLVTNMVCEPVRQLVRRPVEEPSIGLATTAFVG